MSRLLELFALDPEYEDIETAVGPPYDVWQEASRHVLVSRVTGNVDNARFGRPNPTWDDNANVEIWVQGFSSEGSVEAATIAEDTATLVIRSISGNRQLALNDERLDGVTSSWFTELDGPMFLGVGQGVIVSFRLVLFVKTLVRTES